MQYRVNIETVESNVQSSEQTTLLCTVEYIVESKLGEKNGVEYTIHYREQNKV